MELSSAFKALLVDLQRIGLTPIRTFQIDPDSFRRVYSQPKTHVGQFLRSYWQSVKDTCTPSPHAIANPTTNALAASAATKEEVERAQQRRAAGDTSNPVETSKRIWRPQVTSEYKEPDCIPDPLGDMEILYKDYGKPLWINKTVLPPRDDVIQYCPTKHNPELARNLQWRDCPDEHKPTMEQLIKQFWDVFAEEGVRNHIRGALFHVDTGEIKPVCCKPPRYGPHETRVINDLVSKLEKNGLVEDDDFCWGSV